MSSHSKVQRKRSLLRSPWRTTVTSVAAIALITVPIAGVAATAGTAGAATAGARVSRPAPPTPPAPPAGHVGHALTTPTAKLGAAPDIAASVSATLVVNTSADTNPGSPSVACAAGNSGTCSLRAAVAVANAASGVDDAITVPSGRNITLTLGVITTTHSMVINGPGATVNGGGAQIFDVNGGAAQITGLILTGGHATDGGAIELQSGSLVLTGVTITHNSATEGGGVYNNGGSLWMDGSTVSANSASNGGGGAYLYEGASQIENSTFGGTSLVQGNVSIYGAGIYNGSGVTTVTDVTLSYNSTGVGNYGYGGGLYNSSVLEMSGSTVDHNVELSGGEGAGIYSDEELTVSNTTIDDNSITDTGNGAYGAGYYDDGNTTSFINVNVDGNSAITTGSDIEGGAVYSDSGEFTWNGGSIVGTVSSAALTSGHYNDGGVLYDDDVCHVAEPQDRQFDGHRWQHRRRDHLRRRRSERGQSPDLGDEGARKLHHRWQRRGGHRLQRRLPDDGWGSLSPAPRVTADLAGAATPSVTQSYVQGGLLYNDDSLKSDGLSATGTTVKATGGNGYVDGGGIENTDYAIYNNTQIVGLSVTTDDFVGGGFVYNDEYTVAKNLTLGAGTVAVTGGPDATDPDIVGGILQSTTNLTLVNGTLDNVTATIAGTALEGSTLVEISGTGTQDQFTNTTIANDSVSGPAGETAVVEVRSGSTLSLLNTIVSSSTPAINCQTNGVGTLISAGHNLDNGSSCGFTQPGDLQNSNPEVAALADNGGPRWRPAPLLQGSPAIDAGTNNGCPSTDARGVARPQGPACDIGAYETANQGYLLVAADGGIFNFGAATFFGSMGGSHLNAPIVGTASTPDGKGYWDGGGRRRDSSPSGDATFYGSMGGQHLNAPIVGIATTKDGKGYWEVAADGGIFSFGDAAFHGSAGSIPLNQPIVGIAATPDGNGYWEVAADGGIFSFGDATFYGSTGGQHLNEPIVGIAAGPGGKGYWLVASDGGIFSFGAAAFYGSMGGQHLNEPVVGIAATPDGKGYWETASDGGILRLR